MSMQFNLNEPFTQQRDITPSDSVDCPLVGNVGYPRSIYVGTAGDVSVLGAGDTVPKVWKNYSGIIPGCIKRVYLTGTSASNIIGLY